MRHSLIFFVILLSCFARIWAATSLDEGDQAYKQALELIKKADKESRGQVIQLLKKARGVYLENSEGLSEADEVKLAKISSLLYWQLKFNTMAVATETKPAAENKPPTPPPAPEADQPAFVRKRNEVEAYETQHKHDYYNNMLHYLELQEEVPDTKSGEQVAEKTEFYYTAHAKEVREVLERHLHGIEGYDKLKAEKKYDVLAVRVGKLLAKEGLPPKEQYFLAQHQQGLKAMQLVVELLKQNTSENLRYTDPSSDIEGTVGKVSEQGLQIYLQNRAEPAFLSWEMLDENAIMRLAVQAIHGESQDDLLLLGVLNLRLGRFEDSFDYWTRLIGRNPAALVQYKGYLEECEHGFRVKVGQLIEKELERAVNFAKVGKKEQALAVMKELQKNYMVHPLAAVYQKRYYVTFKELASS